jgi:hypothetical protein
MNARSMYAVSAVAFILSAFTACKSPSGPEAGLQVKVFLYGVDSVADDSSTYDLSTLTPVSLEGRTAVKVSDMVPVTMIPKYDNKTPGDASDDVDLRPLYGYRLVGSDGFSAHVSRGADDLVWTQILLAYLYADTRDATFDATLDLSGMYRTKDIERIEIYREIGVEMPDTSWLAVISEKTKVTINSVEALMLTDIISGVAAPETNQYTIVAVDGFSKTLTWEEFQTAYISIAADQVNYTVEMSGAYKLKFLKSVSVSIP